MSKNYIYVSKVAKRSPWKLFFKGKRLEALAACNEEETMFAYPTGQQALLVALKLRETTSTGAIVVITDPDLKASVGLKEPDTVEA